jgi:hypothetical protein
MTKRNCQWVRENPTSTCEIIEKVGHGDVEGFKSLEKFFEQLKGIMKKDKKEDFENLSDILDHEVWLFHKEDRKKIRR